MYIRIYIRHGYHVMAYKLIEKSVPCKQTPQKRDPVLFFPQCRFAISIQYEISG